MFIFIGSSAVENSTYGRVADIHRLLPLSGLSIVDEAFVRVHINVLGVKGTTLDEVCEAQSHQVLLGQCRGFLAKHSIAAVPGTDTAGSALAVAKAGNPKRVALASELAAEMYGLEVLERHIEDKDNNTTRFLVMEKEQNFTRRGGDRKMMTSLVFQCRNIPAALFKALGGFATNGVNMTKIESYIVQGAFGLGNVPAQFYADIVGHPDDDNVKRALEELEHFTTVLHILGVYPSDRENQ